MMAKYPFFLTQSIQKLSLAAKVIDNRRAACWPFGTLRIDDDRDLPTHTLYLVAEQL
jgi:hypothetical protein